MEVEWTDEWISWLHSLRDRRAHAKVLTQVARMRAAGQPVGDLKVVGEGVSEARIHYGPGYRVYFHQRGTTLLLLLAGGDKSTQSQDIRKAQSLLAQIKEERGW